MTKSYVAVKFLGEDGRSHGIVFRLLEHELQLTDREITEKLKKYYTHAVIAKRCDTFTEALNASV